MPCRPPNSSLRMVGSHAIDGMPKSQIFKTLTSGEPSVTSTAHICPVSAPRTKVRWSTAAAEVNVQSTKEPRRAFRPDNVAGPGLATSSLVDLNLNLLDGVGF